MCALVVIHMYIVPSMQKPLLKRVECVCIGAHGGGKTAIINPFWEFPMAIQHKPINKTNFKRILHLFCIFAVNYCLFCDCTLFLRPFFWFSCANLEIVNSMQCMLMKWWIKVDTFEASQYYFNGKMLEGLFSHPITRHTAMNFSLCIAQIPTLHMVI